MGDKTKIEWTDATWNALKGCSRVSEGCRNCYAESMAARFSDAGQWGYGLATRKDGQHRWTGVVVLDLPTLEKPLRWRKPRRIFVTSVADPFHPQITDEMLDRLFQVIAACPQHTFQLLTKRPERMRQYFAQFSSCGPRMGWITRNGERPKSYGGEAELIIPDDRWPLPNLWLGVSVEDQAAADERIPHLLTTPAALRFLSCEPLLGPVNLRQSLFPTPGPCWEGGEIPGIDWVICGGESGPKARPMHPDWARGLRDQCAAAGVPFFFKQWGEWHPAQIMWSEAHGKGEPCVAWPDGTIAWGREEDHGGLGCTLARVGKAAAGRLLDGREHLQFPMGGV